VITLYWQVGETADALELQSSSTCCQDTVFNFRAHRHVIVGGFGSTVLFWFGTLLDLSWITGLCGRAQESQEMTRHIKLRGL